MNAPDKRIGRQTPTDSVVLPYEDTKGGAAVLLYEQSGQEAIEWQELMMSDIMAVNDEGLWTHMKFGWSIPRRNGKSELLIMRSIWGLTHEERVLYTAHRTTTSSSAYLKIIRLLDKMGFRLNEDYKTTRGHGLEHIEWLKSRDGEPGIINFRTRTGTGGLGEGYDLLIIDEAQEYTADQETALKYVVTDSPNPQTLMCGTPPTAVSGGTVFTDFREKVLSGKETDSGWAEWGVNKLSNAHDVELWYETNPSLGVILSERTVRSELNADPYFIDDNIQRLGLWILYSQKSAISRAEWRERALKEPPTLPENHPLFIGVKYGKDTENVSAAVAVRLDADRIFVEALDCRSQRDGNAWLIAYMKNPNVTAVVIDGAGNQQILAAEMEDAGIELVPTLPKVSDIVEANTLFEKRLFSGGICHAGQPALEQSVSNSEHRAIGNNGGFGYRSMLDKADVTLLEAVSLAHRACALAEDEEEIQTVYV